MLQYHNTWYIQDSYWAISQLHCLPQQAACEAVTNCTDTRYVAYLTLYIAYTLHCDFVLLQSPLLSPHRGARGCRAAMTSSPCSLPSLFLKCILVCAQLLSLSLPTALASTAPSPFHYAFLSQDALTWYVAEQSWADLSTATAIAAGTPSSTIVPTIAPYDFTYHQFPSIPSTATNLWPMTQFLNSTSLSNPPLSQLSGIVFDSQNQYTTGMAMAAHYYDVPIISCTVNDYDLMDRSNFGNVVSNQTPDIYTIYAALALCRAKGWTQIAFFATEDLVGQNWMALVNHPLVRTLFAEITMEIFYLPSLVVQQASAAVFNATCQTTFAAAKAQGFTIFFLAPLKTIVNAVMVQAYLANVTGYPYQWLGNTYSCQSAGGANSILNFIGGPMQSIAAGFICFQQGYPRNTVLSSASAPFTSDAIYTKSSTTDLPWYNYRYKMYNSVYNIAHKSFGGTGNPGLSWAVCYEASFWYAAAVQYLQERALPTTSANMLTALLSVNFTGPYSNIPYVFDENGLMMGAPVDVLNAQFFPDGSYAKWQYMGSYFPDTNQLVLSQPLVYSSLNTSTIPLDYIPVYGDGQQLPLTFSAGWIIAALALGTLAHYTAALAIAAGVYSKRRGRDPAKHLMQQQGNIFQRMVGVIRASAVRACTACYTWMIVSALCMSCGVMVSVNYLLFCVASIPVVGIGFDVGLITASAVVPFLLCLLCCVLMQSSIEYNSMRKYERFENMNNSSNQYRHDHKQTDPHSQTAKPVSKDKKARQQSLRQRLRSGVVLSWLMDCVDVVVDSWSVSLPFATLAFVGAIVSSIHIGIASWDIPMTYQYNLGTFLVIPILGLPLSCYILCCVFHRPGYPPLTRAILSLEAAAIVVVENSVVCSAYTVMFSRTLFEAFIPSSSYVSYDSMLVGVSGMLAAVVLLLIGLVMEGSKMSKNAMDVLLFRAQVDMQQVELTWTASKEETKEKQRQADSMRQLLELILSCRPLHRDHALAWSLTAPAASTTSGAGANNRRDTKMGDNDLIGAVNATPALTVSGLFQLPKQDDQALTLLDAIRTLPSLSSGPTSHQMQVDVTLSLVLGNVVTLELFKDELLTAAQSANSQTKKSSGVECLSLWMDIQRFKALEDGTLRLTIGRQMYDTYWSARARFPANIPAERVGSVTQMLHSTSASAPRSLFVEVEAAALSQLQRVHFPSFQSSNAFKLSAFILGHPDYHVTAPTRGGGADRLSSTIETSSLSRVGTSSTHHTKNILNSSTMKKRRIIVSTLQQSKEDMAAGEDDVLSD